MALFGKKPMSAEEIIKAIQSLDEGELEKVVSALSKEQPAEESAKKDPEVPEQSASAETEEGEEPAAEEAAEEFAGEDAAEAETPKSPAPEEVEPEDAEPEEESPPAEPPEETDGEHEAENELVEAENARLAAMEQEIAGLKEMLEHVVSQLEDRPFGQSPQPPAADPDDDDDRIMRSYYGAGYNRAKL